MDVAPRSDPDPVVEAYKKDIDRTLIRNLKLTLAERFRKSMQIRLKACQCSHEPIQIR
jgi:hypothetical protein